MTGFAPVWIRADEEQREEGKRAYIPAAFGEEDRYQVQGVLARAGQGYTLLATDTWSGGDVVIKGMWWADGVLRNPRFAQEQLDTHNADRSRGLRAARQAMQLTQQCPVLISVETRPSPSMTEAGAAHPLPESFLVQQFIGYGDQAARTLADEVKERTARGEQFAPSELLDLAEQLCNTLSALHTARGRGRVPWIHADVKPENVLVLGPPWRYVLIDYDAAVPAGEPVATTTEAYAPPPETDGLAAPEQDRASERFDIYMLGATLAEVAAGGRLSLQQRRNLYYGDKDAWRRASQQITELGYGPILTAVITTSLAAPEMRLSSVDLVRFDLARARSATAVLEALS